MSEQQKEKMTIIFFSGTRDKAIAAMILATTAASMNMDVSIFFTFWGLNFLKKGRVYKGKSILQKMMEFMMPSSRSKLPLTSMNMMGLGPAMMKKLMESTKTPSLEEFFKMAKAFNVKIYACSTSCGIMGVDNSNMIEGVDGQMGAAAFLGEAQKSKINLFI